MEGMEEYDKLHNKLQTIFSELVKTFNKKYGLVFTFHSRLKSEKSINTKLLKNEKVNDVIGFRILNPWVTELYRLVKLLPLEFEKFGISIKSKILSEKNRVFHLECIFQNTNFELQLWPSIMYYCFEYEHSRIYKNNEITEKNKQLSKELRIKQHLVQDFIDKNKLVPY